MPHPKVLCDMTKTLFLPWEPQLSNLTVEDLGDSLYELEERVRSFVIYTGSKYKGAQRTESMINLGQNY
jgi:hypothetical protein